MFYYKGRDGKMSWDHGTNTKESISQPINQSINQVRSKAPHGVEERLQGPLALALGGWGWGLNRIVGEIPPILGALAKRRLVRRAIGMSTHQEFSSEMR